MKDRTARRIYHGGLISMALSPFIMIVGSMAAAPDCNNPENYTPKKQEVRDSIGVIGNIPPEAFYKGILPGAIVAYGGALTSAYMLNLGMSGGTETD